MLASRFHRYSLLFAFFCGFDSICEIYKLYSLNVVTSVTLYQILCEIHFVKSPFLEASILKLYGNFFLFFCNFLHFHEQLNNDKIYILAHELIKCYIITYCRYDFIQCIKKKINKVLVFNVNNKERFSIRDE